MGQLKVIKTSSFDKQDEYKINDKLSKPNMIRLTFDEELYSDRWQQAEFKHQMLHYI